jgi:hypothetical protein
MPAEAFAVPPVASTAAVAQTAAYVNLLTFISCLSLDAGELSEQTPLRRRRIGSPKVGAATAVGSPT